MQLDFSEAIHAQRIRRLPGRVGVESTAVRLNAVIPEPGASGERRGQIVGSLAGGGTRGSRALSGCAAVTCEKEER